LKFCCCFIESGIRDLVLTTTNHACGDYYFSLLWVNNLLYFIFKTLSSFITRTQRIESTNITSTPFRTRQKAQYAYNTGNCTVVSIGIVLFASESIASQVGGEQTGVSVPFQFLIEDKTKTWGMIWVWDCALVPMFREAL
jgi:hypothetical protein